MKTETKVLLAILIFSAIFLTGAVFLLSKGQKPEQTADNKTVYQIDYSTGHKIGTDSAKIKLVEFSDLQCPACKAFEPFLKQTIEENKDKILFVYKHFPLPQHINSRAAANFSEYAATEGKFWEIHDKLFETQEQWANLQDPSDYFAKIGKDFGLDEAKIKEAVGKSLYNEIINKNRDEGNAIQVSSTPTVLLNGVKLSLQDYSSLKQEIQKQLK